MTNEEAAEFVGKFFTWAFTNYSGCRLRIEPNTQGNLYWCDVMLNNTRACLQIRTDPANSIYGKDAPFGVDVINDEEAGTEFTAKCDLYTDSFDVALKYIKDNLKT